MSILEEVLHETEAKPIAKINGVDVYTYAEGQKVNRLHLAEEKITGKQDEIKERPTTADGMHYLHSETKVSVINPERYFLNRFRQTTYNGAKAIEIVTDYRAINEQKSGRIYTNVVNTYILGEKQVNKTKKLELLAQSTVSDKEFCTDFRQKLGVEDAKKVFSVISEQSNPKKEESSLDSIFA